MPVAQTAPQQIATGNLLFVVLVIGAALCIWLFICYGVGKLAESWMMSFWAWFLIAVLFSPLISFAVLVIVKLVSGTVQQVRKPKKRKELPVYSPLYYGDEPDAPLQPSLPARQTVETEKPLTGGFSKCGNCGADNPGYAKTCWKCQRPLGAGGRLCPNCGIDLPSSAVFCYQCGRAVSV